MIKKLLKKRWLILFSLLLVLQISALFYIAKKEESLREEYEKNLRLLERYREKLKELPKVKAENKKLRSELEALKKRAFRGANESIAYAELLTEINGILRELGVKGEFITKLPPKRFGDVNIVRASVRFRSDTYEPVLRFMERVENNPKRLMFFETLRLDAYSSGKGVKYLNLNATVGGVWLKDGQKGR